MNYLTLVQRVWREVGYQGSGPASVNPSRPMELRVIDWVRQAHDDIQNGWSDWNFLWGSDSITTVADTADYSGPTTLGLWSEDTVRIGDEILSFIPHADYRRDPIVYVNQDQPVEFTLLPNKQIRLLPTPDAAYTVNFEYYRTPLQLDTDTDEPLIPEEFQDAIIWRAKMFWAQYEEAMEQLQFASAAYQEAMIRLQNDQLPGVNKHHKRLSGVDIVVSPQ